GAQSVAAAQSVAVAQNVAAARRVAAVRRVAMLPGAATAWPRARRHAPATAEPRGRARPRHGKTVRVACAAMAPAVVRRAAGVLGWSLGEPSERRQRQCAHPLATRGWPGAHEPEPPPESAPQRDAANLPTPIRERRRRCA